VDANDLQRFLSPAARGAVRNEIRELLKLIAKPDILSLAGGLPPPESFPVAEFGELIPALLRDHAAEALQYGPTEGDVGLRRELIRMMDGYPGMAREGLTPEHVLITSASQQALDLCGRIFITPGDVIVCGLPSYLGALGAFTACGARLSGIPLDEEGLRTDLLEQRLIELRREGVRPKLIYTVPDFQNPAGVTLGLSRRRELLAIAAEFDVLVIEDTPYRQLRYVEEALPSLGRLDREGRVISLFTFSKILSPGLRLGWVVASPEIIARLVVAKQPVDLCTSGLSQTLAREYLRRDLLPAQIERIRVSYARKREALLTALDAAMDPQWGVSWTRPQGGLFLWVRLPPWMAARELLDRALSRKVAFVSGGAFHCDGSGSNTLRLNFSYPSIDELGLAARRIAECIGELVREHGAAEPSERVPAEPALLVNGEHALRHLDWNLGLYEVVE